MTISSRADHLQKGHGVSFADYDSDGDLDLFCDVGGAAPGDASHNILLQNPHHWPAWLRVKLVGTKSNRAALGAKIDATVTRPHGETRSIYRTVGGNSSFGGNSLAEHLGLGDDGIVTKLEITWPSTSAKQTLQNLSIDREIIITESADGFQVRSFLKVITPA